MKQTGKEFNIFSSGLWIPSQAQENTLQQVPTLYCLVTETESEMKVERPGVEPTIS